MAALSPASRAAQTIGAGLITQLDNHLADLALDPDAKPDDAVLAAFDLALRTAESLIVAGKGGNMSVGYALAHVAPSRPDQYDDRDLSRDHARVTHALRVLQSLYGPQQAAETCPGGC
jgi:hypothetical protein